MIAKVSEKVAGGKLVRLELEHDGSRITQAKITGDFFMHPEDSIVELENTLVGMDMNASEAEITAKLSSVINSNSIELVGFSAETIARLAKSAMAGGGQTQ